MQHIVLGNVYKKAPTFLSGLVFVSLVLQEAQCNHQHTHHHTESQA